MINSLKPYKICLNIKLIEDFKIKLKLIHINSIVSDKTNIYYDSDNNFYIFVYGNLYVNNNVLKLPEKNNIKNDMSITFDFKDDNDRYDYLKTLYNTLQKWTCDKSTFNNHASKIYKNNISIIDNFWFVI